VDSDSDWMARRKESYKTMEPARSGRPLQLHLRVRNIAGFSLMLGDAGGEVKHFEIDRLWFFDAFRGGQIRHAFAGTGWRL
jgi:hypothetical protein